MPESRGLSPLLEACVTSPEEAVSVVRGGAQRLELCRELAVGGLTPATDQLHAVREALAAAGLHGTPVFCMVRPHPGPFVAGPGVLPCMLREIRDLRAGGAAGLVLGVVTGAGEVDRDALRVLMDAAGDLAVTFHRAFDRVPDPERALEVLGEEGVARVLTAGGQGTAWEGRDALAALVAASLAAPDLPRILGAGGIRGDHAVALLRHTGLREIHARASAYPALARAVLGASTEV